MTGATERHMFGKLGVGLFLGLLLLAGTTRAQDTYAYGTGGGAQGAASVIVWVGTVATNVFYIPAKCVHAALGGITGGLGWLLTGGDTDAANGIWYPTFYGTYVVTPGMLHGKED